MRSSIFTALPIALIIFVGAVHGFEVDVDPSVGQSVGRATEKGLAATNALENKRKAERAARDAARRAAAKSNLAEPMRPTKVDDAFVPFVQQEVAGQSLMGIHRRAHLLTAHVKLIIGESA